jgi:hypothetical protein
MMTSNYEEKTTKPMLMGLQNHLEWCIHAQDYLIRKDKDEFLDPKQGGSGYAILAHCQS